MASIIESHEAKGDVPPYPDTKVTLAFGDDVFPVLVARLRGAAHDDVLLSGLQAAIRLLPTPLNGVKATEAKAVEAFVGLAEHGSPAVRRKAVQALEILLQTPQAKEVFVSGGHLAAFQAVLHDKDEPVQIGAFKALDVLATTYPWPGALQAAGYVPLLVKIAKDSESIDVKIVALKVLSGVTAPGTPGQLEAVSCGGVAALLGLLGPSVGGKVREESCRSLARMLLTPEGRARALEASAAPVLLGLLADRAAPVRAEAAGAIMALSVDNSAKEALLAAGLQPLAKAIGDADAFVRMNAMRAAGSLSASPDCRSLLKGFGALDGIKAAVKSSNALEVSVATRALEVVSWAP